MFTIHYLQGGITLDKGCFMPFQRCKTNTSRRVNIAVRVCVLSDRLPAVSIAMSTCLTLSFFNLPVVFFFFFTCLCCLPYVPQWKAQCKQMAPAACQLLRNTCLCIVACLHLTKSVKVNLVHGLLRRQHLNGSPHHCASCLFLVQTALLAKPLLPHHGPLPFGNMLTVKSLPLLVCAKSHEYYS